MSALDNLINSGDIYDIDTLSGVNPFPSYPSVGVIKGDVGASATIEVGTVYTTSAGTSANVINVGTTSAAVLDFYIPRGANGSLTEESDPIFTSSVAYNITSGDINNWNDKLSAYTETDPIFTSATRWNELNLIDDVVVIPQFDTTTSGQYLFSNYEDLINTLENYLGRTIGNEFIQLSNNFDATNISSLTQTTKIGDIWAVNRTNEYVYFVTNRGNYTTIPELNLADITISAGQLSNGDELVAYIGSILHTDGRFKITTTNDTSESTLEGIKGLPLEINDWFKYISVNVENPQIEYIGNTYPYTGFGDFITECQNLLGREIVNENIQILNSFDSTNISGITTETEIYDILAVNKDAETLELITDNSLLIVNTKTLEAAFYKGISTENATSGKVLYRIEDNDYVRIRFDDVNYISGEETSYFIIPGVEVNNKHYNNGLISLYGFGKYFKIIDLYSESVLPSCNIFGDFLVKLKNNGLISTEIVIPFSKIIRLSEINGIHANSNVLSGGGDDDTEVIQNVIDYAIQTGGCTFIVDGAFLISGIEIGSNCYLKGLGENTGFYLADGSNTAIIKNKNMIGTNDGSLSIIDENMSIENMTLNGNEVNNTSEFDINWNNVWIYGIAFIGFRNMVVKNVEILNARTFASLFANYDGLLVENYRAYWTTWDRLNKDGIHFWGPCYNTKLQNIYSNGNDDTIGLCCSENQSFNSFGPHTSNGVCKYFECDGVYFDGDNAPTNLLRGIRLLGTGDYPIEASFKNLDGNITGSALIHVTDNGTKCSVNVSDFDDLDVGNIVYVGGYSTVENLYIKSNINKLSGDTSSFISIGGLNSSNVTVDNIIIEGAFSREVKNGSLIKVYKNSILSNLTLNNFYAKNFTSLVEAYNNTSVFSNIYFGTFSRLNIDTIYTGFLISPTELITLHNDLAGLNIGDYQHLTSAEKNNLSGINTGDETLSTIKEKLLISGIVDDGNSGSLKNIDFSTSLLHKLTMTDDCILTFTAPAAGSHLTLTIIQKSDVAKTITFPSTVKCVGGKTSGALALSTTLSSENIYFIYYDGTSYHTAMMANPIA